MKEHFNFICDRALNGLEALKLAREKDYNFILMDVNMPVMDGIEATKRILHNARVFIPIIALTAYDTEDMKKRCIEAGMCDFLGKPINIMHLETILKRLNVIT